MKVKHIVEDSNAEERSHPSYLSLPEQWEKQVQAIQRLRVGEAFVRLVDDSVHTVKTPTLPAVTVSKEAVAIVRQRYLERYFEPMGSAATAPIMPSPEPMVTRYPRRLG